MWNSLKIAIVFKHAISEWSYILKWVQCLFKPAIGWHVWTGTNQDNSINLHICHNKVSRLRWASSSSIVSTWLRIQAPNKCCLRRAKATWVALKGYVDATRATACHAYIIHKLDNRIELAPKLWFHTRKHYLYKLSVRTRHGRIVHLEWIELNLRTGPCDHKWLPGPGAQVVTLANSISLIESVNWVCLLGTHWPDWLAVNSVQLTRFVQGYAFLSTFSSECIIYRPDVSVRSLDCIATLTIARCINSVWHACITFEFGACWEFPCWWLWFSSIHTTIQCFICILVHGLFDECLSANKSSLVCLIYLYWLELFWHSISNFARCLTNICYLLLNWNLSTYLQTGRASVRMTLPIGLHWSVSNRISCSSMDNNTAWDERAQASGAASVDLLDVKWTTWTLSIEYSWYFIDSKRNHWQQSMLLCWRLLN